VNDRHGVRGVLRPLSQADPTHVDGSTSEEQDRVRFRCGVLVGEENGDQAGGNGGRRRRDAGWSEGGKVRVGNTA